MRLRSSCIFLAISLTANASSVREEAGVSTVQPTPANPRSGSFTDTVKGIVDLSGDWALNLGGSVTVQGRTPASDRGQFPESGSLVTLFSAGLDWNATESLTLGTELQLAPQSTQFAGTAITLRQANGTETSADALIRSRTSQAGALLSASWDPAADSDLEWAFGASFGYTHYDVDQSIPQVRLADGTTVTSASLRQQTVAYCQAHPNIRGCGQQLLTALKATPAPLDSQRFSANATATIFADTDLGVSADYYFYLQDPSQVGFFSLVAAGRTAGVPIAPLRYLIRPELVHRFGPFSAKLWVSAGEYVQGTGQSTEAAGVRLQYKFTRSFRSWVELSAQRDVDETDQVTRTTSFNAGVAYRW